MILFCLVCPCCNTKLDRKFCEILYPHKYSHKLSHNGISDIPSLWYKQISQARFFFSTLSTVEPLLGDRRTTEHYSRSNIGGLFYAALKITEDSEAGWSWPLYPLDSSLITCSAHLVIKMKALFR